MSPHSGQPSHSLQSGQGPGCWIPAPQLYLASRSLHPKPWIRVEVGSQRSRPLPTPFLQKDQVVPLRTECSDFLTPVRNVVAQPHNLSSPGRECTLGTAVLLVECAPILIDRSTAPAQGSSGPGPRCPPRQHRQTIPALHGWRAPLSILLP